jgi:hypothetical protein
VADTTTAPVPAITPDSTPVVDDSKQWADLAAELEDAPEEEEAAPEPEKVEPEKAPEPEKAKPSYEQLEAIERNKTSALKQEREARRRAEDQLNNYNKMVEELRASRAQRQPTPEPEKPKIPDVNEDPIGHFAAKNALLEERLEQALRGTQQITQQTQAQQQEQVFWSHVQQAENEFRKTASKVTVNGQEMSDYDAACEHLKQHRMTELAMMYPDDSPIAQREAQQYGLPSPAHLRAMMLQHDAAAIAQRAFEHGRSPAEFYYQAAKTRGYTTPQAAPNGKTPPKTSAQIEAQRKGQKASLTISGGEGRKSRTDMNMSDLADLYSEDPEEADKIFNRMAKQGLLG